MSAQTILGRRRPRTLRWRLVTGITALLGVVLVLVGVLSIVIVDSSARALQDTQLAVAMSTFSHSVSKASEARSDDPSTATQPTVNGLQKPLTEFAGQSSGTIIALVSGGAVVDSALFTDTDPTLLTADVSAQVQTAVASGEVRQNVDLDSLGSYRLAVSQVDGRTLVVGVPLAASQAAVMTEVFTIIVLAAVALALAILGTLVVVRLALRPLSRIVDTATEVTTVQLDRGESQIHARVSPADTDPRTETGKVGEALNRLLDHVDDALQVRVSTDRRMRRFVTDASHELRTPLAAIQGYAELTRQDSDVLPPTTEYSLARIESEANRMSSLVSDLLLLARLDEGQDLHIDEVDMVELVLNAVNDAAASAPSHDWRCDVPRADLVLRGDRERLHQLVVNLLSNASTHTPPDSSIRTTVRSGSEGVIELAVADNGGGIDEALQPDLFLRFARGDSGRSPGSGGTGLGLAIALSIVEAHHGSITVESSPRGTTFTVTLPVAPPPGASVPQSEVGSGLSRPSAAQTSTATVRA